MQLSQTGRWQEGGDLLYSFSSSPACASSLGFNLDTEKLTHFHVDSAGFGHSVVQYDGSW